ncbi:MAG: hypothetical protein SFY66_12360 [Oculatellaceae cyanobacterium bins.114]|nr:hypothetical protein [Oculatellaceae cyanobacterium bins.114]
MINIGFNLGSLLGLIDFALGILYVVLSLTASSRAGTSPQQRSLLTIQAVLGPLVLLPVGLVWFTQGWRLDPLLQFALFWLHILVVFSGVKDLLLSPNR